MTGLDPVRLAGDLVAAPIGALARRRHGKPMHPSGAVFDGRLERTGASLGIPWMNGTGTADVVVRLSRGAGLPSPLPDVLGLAIRILGDDGPVDLLLSSTGLGRVTRLVPVLQRDAACGYSSIMGYRSAVGTIRLGALPVTPSAPSEPAAQARKVDHEPLVFTLAAARGLGPWRSFARLTLTAPAEPLDPDVPFDAVLHPPPGLVPSGPLARFRAPAYAAARRARS